MNDLGYPADGDGGLLRVWEQAVPLERAVDAFAGGGESRRLRDSVVGTISALGRDRESPLLDRKAATDRLQAIGQAWERQARLQDAARDVLVARLGAGELGAIAFARRGPAARRLTPIPTAIWRRRPTIDWQAETVSVEGVVYDDLRVVDLTRGRVPRRGFSALP